MIWIALALSFILILIFYIRFIEPYWIVNETIELIDEAIPSGKSLKIILLSDFHLHQAIKQRRIQNLKDRIDRLVAMEKPDMICYAGDFLDHPSGLDYLERLLTHYEGVASFAVLGNHDYWTYNYKRIFYPMFIGKDKAQGLPRKVKNILSDKDIAVLENEQIELTMNGISISIYGSMGEERFDIPAKKDGRYHIGLFHYPDYVLDQKHKLDLALAGHTHGGQVTLFGYPLIKRSKIAHKYVKSHSQLNGMDLIVSKGLGTSRYFPFRFFSRPNIVITSIRGSA